jgi:hypothetical protein
MDEKPQKPPSTTEIELHPDAWERFQKAVDVVMRPRPKPAKDREPSPERGGKRGEKGPA